MTKTVYSVKQRREWTERKNREWIDGQMIEGKASAYINPRVVCTQSGIEGTQMLSGPDSDSEQGFLRERQRERK